MAKGYKMPEKVKKILRKTNKGNHYAKKGKSGVYERTPEMKTGKNPNSHKQTKEIIAKRLRTMKERGIKVGKWNKGLKRTDEQKNKTSKAGIGKHRGEKSGLWRGGFWTKIKGTAYQLRNSFKYTKWRIAVFERDKYTCCSCHKIGGKLNAHHIKRFIDIIYENNIVDYDQGLNCDELWDINNGITLCVDCHRLTDNYANKVNKKIVIVEKTL